MTEKIKSVTDEEFGAVSKKLWEIQNRVKNGTLPVNKDLLDSLQDVIERRFKTKSEKGSILKLISGGEKIMIEALDGLAIIANAKTTFKSHIDPNFRNYGLNLSRQATNQTLLDVHEIIGDSKFYQIFGAITNDLDKIVMSQTQIIRFCEKHPTWLCQDGCATFFLIKENNEYFVVSVDVRAGGLYVFVRRLGGGRVWLSSGRVRLVCPQLIS